MKSDDVIVLTIYGFPLMVNSNIRPNSAPLRDIKLRNLGDLEQTHTQIQNNKPRHAKHGWSLQIHILPVHMK